KEHVHFKIRALTTRLLPRMGKAEKGTARKVFIIMKLTGIILLAFTLHVSATSLAQNVTISKQNGSLKEVFKELRKQTGYYFIYSDEVIKEAKPVTVHVVNENINDALKEIFKA